MYESVLPKDFSFQMCPRLCVKICVCEENQRGTKLVLLHRDTIGSIELHHTDYERTPTHLSRWDLPLGCGCGDKAEWWVTPGVSPTPQCGQTWRWAWRSLSASPGRRRENEQTPCIFQTRVNIGSCLMFAHLWNTSNKQFTSTKTSVRKFSCSAKWRLE